VFLGLDYAWSGGPPILFESMIFWQGSVHDHRVIRYESWDLAVVGHAACVAWVKGLIDAARL
jgi:hypothetical protein